MTIKDATANSLLMFVAATCVVLIVKTVAPTQPASQGGGETGGATTAKTTGLPTPALTDGVRVYYLHSNTRCPTCRTIESYAEEAVRTAFADELKNRQLDWQVINYETPGNEHYATDYNVAAPSVVLVRYKDGKQVDWKGLPEVWEHTGDKMAFFNFVQTSLRDFLGEVPNEGPTPPVPLPTPINAPQDAPLPLPQ